MRCGLSTCSSCNPRSAGTSKVDVVLLGKVLALLTPVEGIADAHGELRKLIEGVKSRRGQHTSTLAKLERTPDRVTSKELEPLIADLTLIFSVFSARVQFLKVVSGVGALTGLATDDTDSQISASHMHIAALKGKKTVAELQSMSVEIAKLVPFLLSAKNRDAERKNIEGLLQNLFGDLGSEVTILEGFDGLGDLVGTRGQRI